MKPASAELGKSRQEMEGCIINPILLLGCTGTQESKQSVQSYLRSLESELNQTTAAPRSVTQSQASCPLSEHLTLAGESPNT